MENDIQWMNESRGTALLLLLLVLSKLVFALTAALDLRLWSACFHEDCCFLESLQFEGALVFDNVKDAARDFGGMTTLPPKAVLYPSSVEDVSTLLRAIHLSESSSTLTVAAKGHAHSIHGQAQAKDGVVIEMSSLRGIKIHKGTSRTQPYADVRGGELWIDVLQTTLREGLAPKSWTDYLYLSVGGTLSNAGISGQTFRHGPQISNVYQLEVVTGKGDTLVCSEDQNSDLFYSTLGGLGQFGIITSARIALEPAPQRVKWLRALYSDFDVFRQDEEYLISQPQGQTFDYVEGFVVGGNTERLIDNWRSSLFKPHNGAANESLLQRQLGGGMLYYLEVTMNYNASDTDWMDKRVTDLFASLHCIPESIYSADMSYLEFLDRVHTGELKLRAIGLWDIPHPWLNLFVPRSNILEFHAAVFKRILGSKGGGPIIVYPMNRSKWDLRMSAPIPDEDIFYVVSFLRSPSNLLGDPTTMDLLQQNELILKFCKSANIAHKQYLPNLSTKSEWQHQFGVHKWATFIERKARYDPKALLAPGQKIFPSRHSIINFLSATKDNML